MSLEHCMHIKLSHMYSLCHRMPVWLSRLKMHRCSARRCILVTWEMARLIAFPDLSGEPATCGDCFLHCQTTPSMTGAGTPLTS